MNGRFLVRAGLALLTMAAALEAGAQSDERLVVPLSDPSRPALLEVNLVFGSVTVNAYNGAEIVIVAKESVDDDEEDERERDFGRDEGDEDDEDDEDDARRAGLTVIPNVSFDLVATERENTVTVRMAGPPRELDLEISVPRRTSVHARTVNGEVMRVTGVLGEHELQNVNGDVFATDIAGSAVINTQNGEVRASFTEITAGKAMSFSSFNGDVDVAFPANLAAELHVNSGRGELRTDFAVRAQPQAPVVERDTESGRSEWRMKQEWVGLIGAGGPVMQFRTFNGDVLIRKR